MHKSAQALVREYQEIFERADAEGRDLSIAENKRVQELVESARTAKEIESFSRQLVGASSDPTGGAAPGDVFIGSQGYKAVARADMRPQTWSSGPVEVMGPQAMMVKGTLSEGVGGAGPGGGLTPPQWQPVIVSKLLEPLGVADIFGQSTTTASQMRYVVEGTAVSGAAGVAELGVKPESALGYTETVEPIKKIATVLPVSDELLEDAASIQGYLNQRLLLFVRVEEERQLLRGAGTNELVGLMNASRGINVYSKAAGDDNVVALTKVIANTAGSSFVQPDAIVLHPSNWLSIRLLRDGVGGTTGSFYGAGPFGPSGNNAGAPGLFGQNLWGLPVVLSNVVGAGTALVGNFRQSAHIWRRGGVSLEATNSHSDLFVRNITMLRAEERLGLGVYRNTAFTEVRGLV
jgi:HK97 family phage major capsid protein